MADFDFMNSPSFGVMGGVAARSTSDLQGMQAMKLLGEIAAQPDELVVKRAHARYYSAAAAENESKARETEELGRIARSVGGGETSDPLELLDRISSKMIESGRPVAGAALADKAAGVRQKIASTAASVASAELREARGAETKARRLGGLLGAAMESPSSWPAIRMQAISEGYDMDGVPEDFGEAQGVIRPLAQASMTVAEQARVKAAQLQQGTREAAQRTRAAAAGAAIRASEARTRLTQERLRQAVKDGGENSSAAAALRRSLAAESAVRTEGKKKLDETLEGGVPLAPANPALRRLGAVYKAPSGAGYVKWNGSAWERAAAPAGRSLGTKAGEVLGSALRALGVSEALDEEDDDDDAE